MLGIENKWAAAIYLGCMAAALACALIGLWGWLRARRRARALRSPPRKNGEQEDRASSPFPGKGEGRGEGR